jgi:hypothetical protein
MIKSANISRALVGIPLVAAVVAAVGCGGVENEPAGAGSAVAAESAKCPPDVPSLTLAVPDGNSLAFDFPASGVQIYACQQTAPDAFAWVFLAPEATLFNPGGQVAGIHFGGPSWQADDGSTVVGARVAAFTVDATAIPWLLLRAASHDGDGRMTKVSYIQRLDTAGGIAPTGGCDATSVGAVANVPYTATYYFYEPSEGNANGPSCG